MEKTETVKVLEDIALNEWIILSVLNTGKKTAVQINDAYAAEMGTLLHKSTIFRHLRMLRDRHLVSETVGANRHLPSTYKITKRGERISLDWAERLQAIADLTIYMFGPDRYVPGAMEQVGGPMGDVDVEG